MSMGAIEFENPVTAGTVLVRDSIQSQNYDPGAAGWRIASDGDAEFSDLTIRSSDGTTSTVTVQNGQITIRDGSGTEVIQIDAAGYRLYSSTGSLLADIREGATDSATAGIYTRNFAFPDNTYSYFAGGSVSFGPVNNALADHHAFIDYAFADDNWTALTISTGEDDQDLDEPARVQLLSERGQTPKVWVDGGVSSSRADLHVSGAAYADNVPYVIRKTSTTVITNDTTFTSDPDLQVELEADSVYEVEFSISYGTTANAGFRTQWAFPLGVEGNKMVWGLGSAATSDNNATMRSGVHNLGTNTEYGSRGSSGLYCGAQERAILRTASAGTLALQWSQLTASPDETRVSDDSWLRITKVQP